MHEVTPLRVIAALAVYGALLAVVLRFFARPEDRDERRTYLAIAGVWAVSVFVANYALYLAGVMSFLPWITNFLHAFVWIGVCLTAMYLGVREDWPLGAQVALFAVLSLVVKLAEQALFGTWELDLLLPRLRGECRVRGRLVARRRAVPVLTLLGLRLAGRRIRG